MTEIDMTSLLIKLANLGVTGIKVAYEGVGDSGAIEWIGYTDQPCETPEDVEDIVDAWVSPILEDLDSSAYALIEDFANEKLLQDIEDWWNNEGGFGELCICVPSGKYMISNNIRVTHSENYQHDGSLIDKTLE
jgi:hypothetical protein